MISAYLCALAPPPPPGAPLWLWQGLVTSVGGLSESVVKHSSAALLAWAASPSATAAGAAPLAVLGRALTALLRPRPKMPWDTYVDHADGAAAAPGSARSMGGYAAYDPTMSRWFANILGGTAGSSDKAADDASSVRVDARLVTPTMRTLDVLLKAEAMTALQVKAGHGV
jgi:hypothetical protein